MTNYEEVLYYGILEVGTNQQPMYVNFDTGSSICWIPTTGCTGCSLTPHQYNQGTGGGTYLGVNDEIEYLDGTTVSG